MPILLLIFILIPLAEIAVFIWVGEAIGIGPTIIIVVITAIIGTALLRAQGFSTMARAQKTLSEGGIPVDSVIHGAALLVAGAFLLTPGMITDTLGFLLFVPAFRNWLAKIIFNRVLGKANIDVNIFGNEKPGPFGQDPADRRPPNDGDGPIIDAEFEHINNPDSGSTKGDKT